MYVKRMIVHKLSKKYLMKVTELLSPSYIKNIKVHELVFRVYIDYSKHHFKRDA